MAATHIFDAPPEGVAADWTMPQDWAAFTAEQHEIWRSLFDRQSAALDGYACRSFLGGLDILRDRQDGQIYIVDVNKTDLGPLIALSWVDKIRSMTRLGRALERLVAGG